MIRRLRVVAALAGALVLGLQTFSGTALGDPAATPVAAPGGGASAPASPGASAPGGPVLTLDQAIQEAVSRNPQVVAAQEAVTAAREGVAVARTGLAPTVSLNGTGSLGTTQGSLTPGGIVAPSLTSPTGTGSISLGLDVPIYDSGRTRAAVEAAQAAVADTEAALRETEQNTALQAATAFFDVLSAERLTTVREAQLTEAQQQLALAQAQVRAGVVAQADVIQAQAQVAQAQVNLLQAQAQISTTKAALQAVLAANVAAPIEVQEPPAPALAVTVTAQAVVAQALANRPEIIVAEAAVQSGTAALDLANIDAGPQITVGVGTTYTPLSTSPVLNNAVGYGLTGTVSLPLYDAGKGQAEIKGAQAGLRGAQAQLDAARLSVSQDAYQAYLNAVQAAANVTATRTAQDAADSALRVAEGQYRAGVGTILAVTTAQANAAQAEVNATSALYGYETALATLRHSEGMPVQASTLGGGQ